MPDITNLDNNTTQLEEQNDKLEVIDDPGQFEGIPKVSNKEEFTEKVQDRIDELTKNWRGTERDLKAAIEKLTDRDEEVEELISQNQKLMGIIEGKEKQPKGLDPEEGIRIEIKTVREKMSDARKKLEWDVYDQLEDKLNDLSDQLVDVKVKKVERSKPADGSKAISKNAVAEFTVENSWFDPVSDSYDPMMRGAALEYDDFLLTKKEWKDKPLSVRLKEVKRVVESKFAGTFKSGPPRVEPSRRLETGGELNNTRDYGLSEVEKRVADKMIPLSKPEERYKEYAKQKKIK